MARRGQVRAIAAGLVLALSAPPAVAVGKPRAARPPAPADDPLVKVAALASEAQTRFETADYAAAIDLWSQAYAALPVDPAYGQQRSVLVYQIAQACVEAYAIDPQLTYLRKAERLFEAYVATLDATDREGIAAVQREREGLRAKIDDAERREREAAEAERERAAAAEREREAAAAREREARRREEEVAAAAAVRRAAAELELRRWRARAIAGGVVLGAGVLGLGVMGYGLAWGRQVDRRGFAAEADGATGQELQDLLVEGTRANRLAIASGVAGGALVVAGAVLTAVSVKGQRRARRELAAAPVWLAGGAGLGLRARF